MRSAGMASAAASFAQISADRAAVSSGGMGPMFLTKARAAKLRGDMQPHQNPTHEEIRKLLTEAGTIAVVGASANREKPSHRIMKELLAAGYRVIPVNPRET